MKVAYTSTLDLGEIIWSFCVEMLSYIHIAAVHITLDFHVWMFWVIQASEDDT